MNSALRWLTGRFPVNRAREMAQNYQDLFDSPEGRAVLADLADYCNATQSSFVPGDPCETAYREGARRVYLHICQCAGLNAADFQIKQQLERYYND